MKEMMNEWSQSKISLDVSVVIPAYKRPELLRLAVQSAAKQDMAAERFEVIVVDSSPDNCNVKVVEELQVLFPDICLSIYQKNPEGPGPSRTLGAQHARGAIIAYLDSDCMATPTWLEAGLSKFTEDIGIVQGRTLPRPDQPLGIFKRYLQVEAENPRYEAANIFFRRKSLASAGEPKKDMTPNDERPTGGEDSLMAWRVKHSGWNSTFATQALVYHEVLPISVWDWLYEKRMFMLPWLVREIPEMRGEFFLYYFLDRAHASLTLLLLGLGLAFLSPFWLVCVIPYIVIRASEPTRTLRGLKRIARALVYLPRDLLALGLLLLGSVRYRTLLL